MSQNSITARRWRTMALVIVALAWAAIAVILLGGCRKQHPTKVTQSGASSMGNPSNATANRINKDNYLIEGQYFSLSYNSGKGTPNWVSWRLTKADIGSAPRVGFYPETDLPDGFQVVTPEDYTGSGFDRGHMCPHQDRSANQDMSKATFVMTNMVPQSPPLNEQTWEQLESYCRSLTQQGSTLYIVAGPHGKGGTGREGYRETIGKENRITVPAECWKVIMVVDSGAGDDPAKMAGHIRLIAVVMPNDMRIKKNWATYRTSVAKVEELTGYKFFDKVPADVIDPLKKAVDTTPVAPSAPPKYGH